MADTTLLPPTAVTTGFYAHEDDSCRRERGRDCVDSLLLAGRIDDDTRQVQQEVCNSAHHVLNAMSTDGADTRATVNVNGLDTRRTVDTNGVDTRRTVDTNGVDTRRAVDTNGLDIRRSVDNNGLDIRASVERNGLETRRDVRDDAAETRGLVKNFGERGIDATERFGLYSRDAVDRNYGAIKEEGCKTREEVADYAYRSQKSFSDTDKLIADYGYRSQVSFKDMEKSMEECCCETKQLIQDYGYKSLLEFKETQKDILKQHCETREVVKDKAHIFERQASDNFAVVTRQAAENKCAIELLGFKHTAELQASAEKRANALERQMAECCCEMKELVISKADATDKLIREIDSNRIRDALSDAKNEIIALKIRGGLAPAPVSAISL